MDGERKREGKNEGEKGVKEGRRKKVKGGQSCVQHREVHRGYRRKAAFTRV